MLATIILVLVAFSMEFLVFPFSPVILPIHLERCCPYNLLTSLISKDSRYKSSILNIATQSFKVKPIIKAFKKSEVLLRFRTSLQAGEGLISTTLIFKFILICNCIFSTTNFTIFSQFFFKGLIL